MGRSKFLWALLVVFVGSSVLAVFKPGMESEVFALASFFLFFWALTLSLLAGGLSEAGRRLLRFVRGSLSGRTRPGAALADAGLAALWKDIEKAAADGTAGARADRALAQLNRLAEAYSRFESILGGKLDKGELTYGRYLEAGRQAREGIVRELTDVSHRIQGVAPIRGDRALAPAGQEQLGKVDQLLDGTERAIGQLIRTNIAVAEMRGKGAGSSSAIDELVAELAKLEERARKY